VTEGAWWKVETIPGDARVEVSFDEGELPRDAVYAASFAMIDRAWVHLDRADGKLTIALRAKRGDADLAALVADLEAGLHAEAWRLRTLEEGRGTIDAIVTRAFGGPDEASLDTLLGAEEGEGAFEDPLGIALTWEEKYGKKADGGQST
jgi:hypothetical protein